MNLLHAASLVAGEFDVELIDVRIHTDWEKRLRMAMEIKPVFVGVTSMIGPATTSSIRIAEAAKGLGGVPVVMGGAHPTLPEMGFFFLIRDLLLFPHRFART